MIMVCKGLKMHESGQSHHSQTIVYAVVWGHVMDLAGGAFFGYSQP